MGRSNNTRTMILQFVQDYLRENGYAPSMREIAAAVGLKSTASVHYQLTQLQRDGLLEFDGTKTRAIVLPTANKIPVVGVVTAGVPILATEHIEGYIPWEGDPSCFALKVRGDSMKNAGILNGDTVVVRPQSTADDRQIVVALLGDEATVKRLSLRDGVWLLPENPAYSPIDGREATILGRVRAVVREY